MILLWLFHLVCILYCGYFNLFCNVWVSVCGGDMCGCFGNMCTCIYCVLNCLYCVFWGGGGGVNKANLVHNLFLVYLSITWYLLFCMDDCLVCRVYQSSTQNNKYQVLHKHCYFSCWWAHSCLNHIEIDKYTKNKLCTKLVLCTRLYRDAQSTKKDTLFLFVLSVLV